MEIFISYETTTALDLASNLKKALAKMGITAFIASTDIPKGDSDKEVINDAIRNCTYFVLIMTLVAIASDEVKREIRLANQFGKRIIPAKTNKIDREVTEAFPIDKHLNQINFESKEDLANQVVTEIVKLKVNKGIWANQRTRFEEAAATELSSIQAAVIAMMTDNRLLTLPHPARIATNDMSAFPDITSVAGSADKKSDPNGNAYTAGDKNGYILYQHDIIANNDNTTGLVNYVTNQYTRGTYAADAVGTITQVTTGY